MFPIHARSGRVAALLTLLVSFAPGLVLAQLNEEQKLTPTANASAAAGTAVAISNDGSVAVVGASGDEAAYVYTRSGALWTKVATLTASDSTVGDHFGSAVGITGDGTSANIVVGAPDHSGGGAVYVFTGSDTTWTPNTNNPLASGLSGVGSLGTSVSIQGFRVGAGAPHSTVSGRADTGVAVVFESIDSGATFTSSTFRPNGGQARTGGLFGTSVSLSGNTILVGTPHYHTGNKPNSGNVFVFVKNGANWSQQANIRPANVSNNLAGAAVSLFNNTAAFGAPGNSNNTGAVYVYTRSGTTWSQTAAVTAPGGAAGDQFGSSVAQLGAYLVAGSPFANSNNGAAYAFGSTGGPYTLLDQLVPSDNPSGALFGFSASVNAGRALAGAPADGGIGSAYVFKFLQPSVTTITSTSVDPGDASTGVPYTVFVNVNHDVGGAGTPTGTVHVDDGNGGSCDTAALDGSGNGQCDITSNFFGALTLTASYNGDLSFSPSQGQRGLTVTGNHLEFNPAPADILAGSQFAGTVEVRNGAEAVLTGDNTTQVTITITDVCGNPNVIPTPPTTVTAVNGVATFTGLGPLFYGVASGLSISATPNNAYAGANANVNVVANSDLMFVDSFEDCLR